MLNLFKFYVRFNRLTPTTLAGLVHDLEKDDPLAIEAKKALIELVGQEDADELLVETENEKHLS